MKKEKHLETEIHLEDFMMNLELAVASYAILETRRISITHEIEGMTKDLEKLKSLIISMQLELKELQKELKK